MLPFALALARGHSRWPTLGGDFGIVALAFGGGDNSSGGFARPLWYSALVGCYRVLSSVAVYSVAVRWRDREHVRQAALDG